MPKYTEGPWILADDGRFIYALHYPKDDPHYKDGKQIQCNRFSLSIHKGTNDVPKEEYLANAQLISAAPELVEALQAILKESLSWHTMHGHGLDSVQCDSICKLIPQMQTALRKAGVL